MWQWCHNSLALNRIAALIRIFFRNAWRYLHFGCLFSVVRSFTKIYKRHFEISWNFYKKGINHALTEEVEYGLKSESRKKSKKIQKAETGNCKLWPTCRTKQSLTFLKDGAFLSCAKQNTSLSRRGSLLRCMAKKSQSSSLMCYVCHPTKLWRNKETAGSQVKYAVCIKSQ